MGGKMEQDIRTKIGTWLKTAYGFVGDKLWPRDFVISGTKNPDTSLALAYHAGVRDILVKLLREGDLKELQEVREQLAELDRFKELLR